jgi:hypothetical protein
VPTDDHHEAGIERIRVGVVVEGDVVPAHVADAVARIVGEPGVETTVVARTVGAAPEPQTFGRLFRVYHAVDRRVFGTGRDPHRLVRLDPPPSAATTQDLDVLIVLDDRAPPPSLVQQAGQRVWRNADDAGPTRAFLALARGETSLTSSLVEVARDGRLLERYHSVGPVDRLSLARTEDPLRWKAATYPARALAAVRRDGWESAPTREPRQPTRVASTASLPSTALVTRTVAKLAWRICRRAVQRIVSQNEWFVAYRRRSPGAPPPTDLHGFTPIEAPRGHFYADPFVVATPSGHRLFLEDYARTRRLGSIAQLRLDDERRGPWPATTVLERPFHLSYPFVMRTPEGSLLLIPESGDHRQTTTYRSTTDGSAWEPSASILSGIQAYDPTVLEHGGRFWLFVAVAVPGGSPWDELCLYYGPSPAGPWTAHPANPVVSDVRSARPAGRVFALDGRLIRPAQDCSGAYGRRVVLQEIVRLDEWRYEERPWSAIEPTGLRGVRRTHCYTFDGSYEVVDGFRHRRRSIAVGRDRSGR